MTNEQPVEIWQVEANGQVFDTSIAEITQWIEEGSLLRQDRVRKGNLRWIEAGKVPALIGIFNAVDNGEPVPAPVINTTTQDPSPFAGASAAPVNPTSAAPEAGFTQTTSGPVCLMHPDVEASYTCDTCLNQFCRACPTSYGGTVKICPMCGAMCSALAVASAAPEATYSQVTYSGGPFGFSDLINALAYPFRFKASLVLGGVMYMFFSLGQAATGFGGIYMLSGSIFCFMLANTLTFGILANTVESFAHGKIGGNFMPAFDDFSIWDDVVHPFFLSIGVYLSSFGPLLAVVLIAVFFIAGSIGGEMNGVQSDAMRSVDPELPYAAKAAKQSQDIKGLLNKQQDLQKERVDALNDGDASFDGKYDRAEPKTDPDEEEFNRLNSMIQEQRKAQLESVVGKTPETKAAENTALLRQLLAYGALFVLLAGVCFVWGVFYFPAACAVAGYTRSFGATLNPSVGLDTIRRLGVDYIKLLLMGLVLVVMSGIIGGVIGVALSAFDMPGVGNIPAKAISSLFGFYFSIVFSCVLGFALYKRADRLDLSS